ncbi:MAG: hypothetical protein LBT05_01110 [Planctomycetaceae bacterium]|jgi:hypothetical protein|nr:hypothetical protein [Planctomycetaceae bacterium]
MILETIREQEEIPLEEVRAVAVSRGGVNVLMQEPGKKKGRKRQRSGERKTATEGEFDSPTSYKNAVVGSVTLYDVVPPGRLQSRYVAQMTEDKAVALKPIYGKNSEEGNKQFEEKKKILLEDANGAEKIYRSLKYFEENYKYSAEQDRILQAKITFFKNNKAYMEYTRFRDEGLTDSRRRD